MMKGSCLCGAVKYGCEALAENWAGSLDDDPGVTPSEHVWMNCERPWEQAIDTLPRLTEAQFVLDRIQKHERAGGENIRELYGFLVERYAEDDPEVVATARRRLSELGRPG